MRRWTPGELRPAEGLASTAFLAAGWFWLLALPAAFYSGWTWALMLAGGALVFALGVPFALAAVLLKGRGTAPFVLVSLLFAVGALGACAALTWLLVSLDVL